MRGFYRAAAPPTALWAWTLLAAGCPAPALPPTLHEATIRAGELPSTIPELVKFADDEAKKDQASAEENIVLAVDRGLSIDARNYDLLWRGARACAWLTEEFTDKQRRASWAEKGIDYARRAIEVDGNRVEGHYYLGINLGQSATTKTIGATGLVPKVVKEGEAAMRLDERFDFAGPARLVGTVYAKAPGWPASIGDIDEGMKYLTRAVELAPEYPQNHLHFADALVVDGKLNEAEVEYKRVIEANVPSQWAHRAERWRAAAQAGLKKVADKKSE